MSCDLLTSTEAKPEATDAELAVACDEAARRGLERAARLRERAEEIDEGLVPLRAATLRRASELELFSAALRAVADGLKAQTASI